MVSAQCTRVCGRTILPNAENSLGGILTGLGVQQMSDAGCVVYSVISM